MYNIEGHPHSARRLSHEGFGGPGLEPTQREEIDSGGRKTVKKTMIAALAALMLAGALSAVSGATSTGPLNAVVVIGEGSAPMPAALPPCDGHE